MSTENKEDKNFFEELKNGVEEISTQYEEEEQENLSESNNKTVSNSNPINTPKNTLNNNMNANNNINFQNNPSNPIPTPNKKNNIKNDDNIPYKNLSEPVKKKNKAGSSDDKEKEKSRDLESLWETLLERIKEGSWNGRVAFKIRDFFSNKLDLAKNKISQKAKDGAEYLLKKIDEKITESQLDNLDKKELGMLEKYDSLNKVDKGKISISDFEKKQASILSEIKDIHKERERLSGNYKKLTGKERPDTNNENTQNSAKKIADKQQEIKALINENTTLSQKIQNINQKGKNIAPGDEKDAKEYHNQMNKNHLAIGKKQNELSSLIDKEKNNNLKNINSQLKIFEKMAAIYNQYSDIPRSNNFQERAEHLTQVKNNAEKLGKEDNIIKEEDIEQVVNVLKSLKGLDEEDLLKDIEQEDINNEMENEEYTIEEEHENLEKEENKEAFNEAANEEMIKEEIKESYIPEQEEQEQMSEESLVETEEMIESQNDTPKPKPGNGSQKEIEEEKTFEDLNSSKSEGSNFFNQATSPNSSNDVINNTNTSSINHTNIQNNPLESANSLGNGNTINSKNSEKFDSVTQIKNGNESNVNIEKIPNHEINKL